MLCSRSKIECAQYNKVLSVTVPNLVTPQIDAYLEQLQSELDDQRAAAAAASAAAGEREDVADAAGLANDGAVLTRESRMRTVNWLLDLVLCLSLCVL